MTRTSEARNSVIRIAKRWAKLYMSHSDDPRDEYGMLCDMLVEAVERLEHPEWATTARELVIDKDPLRPLDHGRFVDALVRQERTRK